MVLIPIIQILNQACFKALFLALYYFLLTSMILERNIKYNIKLFADDSMLFSIVKNPEMSANDLNHDLDVSREWTHQWKLEFNPN